MQFTTMILSLIGLFTLTLATDLGLPYKLEPFQYTGTLGGYEVQLNGTVQEIYAQMQEVYPDFKPDLAVRSDNLNLEARAAADKNGLLCCPVAGQDWTYAYTVYIQNGISYLDSLGRCDVGPTTCSRISCSYGSAIFLCNDNDYAIQPSCVYLASYAQDIINSCGFLPFGGNEEVCGQEFDSDHYNIVVRYDSC